MGLFSSGGGDVENADLDCSPQGEYVTEELVAKVDDLLDDGEKVHYMTRGQAVQEEGSGSGGTFGGDTDTSGTFGNKVLSAFTDKRVVVKIPQTLGTDHRSISYDNVTTVDLDTGLVNKAISLQTPAQNYKIKVAKPGKDECREIMDFVRKKLEEEASSGGGGGEPDPTEQLQRIKELHDDGVLTDEEFEEKKASLMEKI